ncbi:MAG: DPP IV N-terminal domain-containing protein, partial [Gammaproteobacteria bacterium]
MMLRAFRLFLVTLLLLFAAAVAAEPPRGSLTIDRIADIRYPTGPEWSPDGKKVAFLWDRAGKQDLFVVTPGQAPVPLTDLPVDRHMLVSNVGRLAWVSDDEILFTRNRQLWSVSPSSPKPAPVDGLADAADFVLSGDRKQIAFVRRGQIWVASVTAKTQRQITVLPEPPGVSSLAFSRDAKSLSFSVMRSSLEAQDLPFNGNWIRQFRNVRSGRRHAVVSVYGGDPVWIPTLDEVSAVQWTADGSILFQEFSADKKTRVIKIWPIGGVPRVLWSDHDPKWWTASIQASNTVVAPDGKSVSFASDRTGWTHLYVMPLDATSASQARPLTSGNFGATFGSWSPDSRRIAYHHSVEGNHQERFIAVVDVASGKSDRIVTSRGVALEPQFSSDGANLVYQRTSVEHSLDLYVVAARAGAKAVRLSNSMPAEILASDLTPPVTVTFPSRVDGKPVPAT